VAEAQAGDPLAPVTVVVPSNVAGITVRRMLGSGALGGAGPAGVANLSVSTPHQLAAHIGGARAAALGVPLSNPVLAAAARRALADAPGRLAPMAGHTSTEQALVRLYGELSHVSGPSLERLRVRGVPATGDLVTLVERVRHHLAGHYDEDDVARAAAAVVRSGAGPAVGTVVLHLLGALSPAHDELIDALAAVTEVVVLAGRTGDDRADAALGRPAVAVAPRLEPPVPVPAVTGIVSVADPDEEVRAVVRSIAGRAEAGLPLDRLAVLYPTEQPYARILHEQLDAGGIAWNGPEARRLAHTAAGRTLTRFLDLGGGDFGRDTVADLVGGGPVRDREGRLVPASRWDRLSRQAGVVGGVEDWPDKLDAFHRQLDAERAAAEAEDDAGRRSTIERDLDDLGRLRAFVGWLLVAGQPPPAAGWRARADWARAALDDLLGPDGDRVSWPESERVAADAVEAALDRVSVLDAVDPAPSPEVFARAVAEELDAPTGRRGAVGVGVLLAPLAAAPGLDVDVVVVVGLAEGTCPASRHEDSLLPDADRRLADGELPLRADRVHVDHGNLLAGLAAGRDERVLVHPRGDHRHGRERLPSRWLLEAAGLLAGGPVHGSDFADLRHPSITRVRSYVDGLLGPAAAASVHDLDVRTLATAADPSAAAVLGADPVLRAGLDAVTARRRGAFTRFDGNLADVARSSPLDRGPLSATRFEAWAACPFRYYLRYELHLAPIERPERITDIGALDRGSLVHEVLERFGREVLARPGDQRPSPGERWAAADHARLIEIAGDVCDEYEARGVTGRPLVWRLRRTALLADFAAFLHHDDGLRARLDSAWEAVEVPFGLSGADPVEIRLAGGRVARFRGVIDRVDRRPDGDVVVLDYKTGKVRDDYDELDDDPVVRGTRVQLALYAEAVRQQHGAERPAAHYWFATSDGEFADRGYDYTAERASRFREVVGLAVDNIENGVFPARPGEFDLFRGTNENCAWCDFDRVCPRDRHEQWTAKASAPELSSYVGLVQSAEGGEDHP
jgi:RecB family exonuclease